MVRSPTDVLRLVVAVIVLIALIVVGAFFDDAIVGFAADLFRGFESLPDWFGALLGFASVATLVVVIVGLVGAVVVGRWHLIASLLVAGVLAAALFSLGQPLADHEESALVDSDQTEEPIEQGDFASGVLLAVVTACVTAAAPAVSRRWRRLGWALVLLLAAGRFAVVPLSLDTSVALATGWVAGAAAVVALAAPQRRPTRRQVADGLGAVGVPIATLEKAGVDARGSTPYFGTGDDGQALFVKALGSDERSADLLFRLFRWVQPVQLGDEKPFSTLRRAVEHEALVALVARDLGVRTPHLVAFSTVEPDAFVLAYEAVKGRSFDRLDPEEVTDEVLAEVWSQVGVLRTHRVAHRDLRLANIFLSDDGDVWIIDFGFSELAASDLLLATDLAELLASSSAQVGVERAVDHGVRAVGAAELPTAVDRLHARYLSGATRTSLKENPGLLDDLRQRLSAGSPAAVDA